MINSKHRFHGHNSLRYVYQHGQTVRGTSTTLKFVEDKRRDTYRLAIVVSKKVSKSAVVRNRIRRRLYESVRRLEPQLTVPYDLVITVFHEQLATIPAEDLQQLVQNLLEQARILPKNKPNTP